MLPKLHSHYCSGQYHHIYFLNQRYKLKYKMLYKIYTSYAEVKVIDDTWKTFKNSLATDNIILYLNQRKTNVILRKLVVFKKKMIYYMFRWKILLERKRFWQKIGYSYIFWLLLFKLQNLQYIISRFRV